MARSVWKIPHVALPYRRWLARGAAPNGPHLWCRNSLVIVPAVPDRYVRIHTGKNFELITLDSLHANTTLGSLTTTKRIGNEIHRYNKAAAKKKKAETILRQKKARKTVKKPKAKLKKKTTARVT